MRIASASAAEQRERGRLEHAFEAAEARGIAALALGPEPVPREREVGARLGERGRIRERGRDLPSGRLSPTRGAESPLTKQSGSSTIFIRRKRTEPDWASRSSDGS